MDSLDDALDHIASYGSNHTEVICTNNHANATRFLREADASLTAVNASTRFNDGGSSALALKSGSAPPSCIPTVPWAYAS